MSFLPADPPHKPSRRLYRGRDVARAVTIADLRAIALARLPRFSAEYLEGGAEQELTLADNRRAFDDYVFAPRVLVPVDRRDRSRDVFGRRSALPFASAPTGLNGLLWPQADAALARAAAAAGIPFGQSTVSNALVSDLAALPGMRHWFQLYVFGPDEVWQTLVDNAARAGSEVLLLTVDGAVMGNREWDRRNYVRPFELSLSARLDALAHPQWLFELWRNGLPRFLNLEPFVPGNDRGFFAVSRWSTATMRPALDWTFVDDLRKRWPGKLVIKGVQTVEDVLEARRHGADGVVLSNHGGRQLDRTTAPLRLIAPARAAVGKDFTLLVDSGFRRGTEIVMALALGADAVLLGRALLYGLAAGGETGAARAIEILAAEIDRTLALLGVDAVDDLTPDVLKDTP